MLGAKIQRARKALGLSLRDLAEKIELSHASVKKYEDGLVIPASDILIKLGKALQVRVEYFFRPEKFTLDSIRYREHAGMPQRYKEEITARILDQFERRIELENLLPSGPIKNFSLKQKNVSHYEDIEEIADLVRKEWSLGSEPLSDVIDIFEEHGIKVFVIDEHNYEEFDGLSASVNNIPLVVIDSQRPGDRQRFTLAHELGHLVLTGFSGLDEEKCCNRFAGAFLLPKKMLVTLLGEHRNYIEPRELELLKQEFGISMQSILHRAQETQIISDTLYHQLRSEFKERGWSKREPGVPYPRQRTHLFEQMVFRALAEEFIGESKAAELMNLPIETFRKKRAMECKDVVSQ